MIAAALVAAATSAAAAQAAQPSATCAGDLDRLAAKVEENYAGFLLEITGAARDAYRERLARLRAAADTTRGDACFFVLREYVDGFEDPHLFVFQSTRRDTAATLPIDDRIRRVDVDEGTIRGVLARDAGSLDPIEGIYADRGLRVAILAASRVASPLVDSAEFLAIVLTPDTATWRAGDVRAVIGAPVGGAYEAKVWERNGVTRHLRARLHGRRLLRMAPVMWGKTYPLTAADAGRLDSLNPRRPTLVRRGAAIVVTMPSHDPAYRAALDSLVEVHRGELERAEYLIVDLRGNEGGSSATSNALLPYIVSDSQRPSPLADGEPMMLSSPDQIAYATRFFAGPAGPDSSPRLQRLLARMRASPGNLVALLDSGEAMPEPPRVEPIHGPRRVAVIVDGGTVSAAEVLVAKAMRSTRVTVYGQPTEGALDYQSTYIVPFQVAGRRWYLGYPTITAHSRLPEGGIRGRGIAPHVRLDLEVIPDVVGHVERLLSGEAP